jgi:hypothetical protein
VNELGCLVLIQTCEDGVKLLIFIVVTMSVGVETNSICIQVFERVFNLLQTASTLGRGRTAQNPNLSACFSFKSCAYSLHSRAVFLANLS